MARLVASQGFSLKKPKSRRRPSGDRDRTTYIIKSEEDFEKFINKYKKEVMCDLKSVADWLVVDKEDDHSDMWQEEDDKLHPSGYKLMINEHENKPNVISYLKDKIVNIETFYLS